MKPFNIANSPGFALLTAVALCAGCSPSEPQQNAPVTAVRGEAISAPIAEANVEATPAPAPGTSTKAVAAKTETTPTAPAEASKPAQPTPSTATKPEAKEAKTEDGFMQVGFEKLASFNYDVPDGPVEAKEGEKVTPLKPNQIPQAVSTLNNKKIALQGFMLPLKVENGLITEMLIMRDQSMCCYGTVPKINEWVSVKMTGKGVKPIMDQAVTVYGTLKVGEMLENGYLVGIYQLDGERMAGPLEL